jgi:hypothetical protein
MNCFNNFTSFRFYKSIKVFIRCNWYKKILLLIFTPLLVLCAPLKAESEIVDCYKGSDPKIYCIHLDEPAYNEEAFKSDKQMQSFMNSLYFLFDQERDSLWVEKVDEEEIRIIFQVCNGRKPTIDGSEFDAALVDQMYNKGVILEIWSRLDAKTREGKIEQRQAHIGYLLVPVEFAYHSNEGPSGLFLMRYPEKNTTPTENFLELFDQNSEIDAFVAASLGIKAQRSGKLKLAQKNLCKAKLLFEQTINRTKSKKRREKLKLLIGFLVETAKESIRKAKKNPGSGGTLILLDPNLPCPEDGSL